VDQFQSSAHYLQALLAGCLSLRARAGTEGSSSILEMWGQGGLLKELHVPKTQHGAVFGDGWFSGSAWSPAEGHVAYVAEARGSPVALQSVSCAESSGGRCHAPAPAL